MKLLRRTAPHRAAIAGATTPMASATAEGARPRLQVVAPWPEAIVTSAPQATAE